MSNSGLISGVCLNTACSNDRNDRGPNKIRKITIHHMAGINSAMDCAQGHINRGGVSANYYIGNGGEIVLGVDESRRAWTSDSRENDYQAVTIEVSNSIDKEPWTVSDKAYKSLIALCVDICRRNDITPTWTGDSSGTFTCHYMFAATACPGTYLKNKMPEIVAEVKAQLAYNATFLSGIEQVYNVRTGDTWETIGARYGVAGVHLLEYNNYKTANAKTAKMTVTQKTIKIPARFVKGDVDGDGVVTAKDARKILRASAKLASLTPAERMRADINADGKITAADARAALKTSAKM